MGQWSQDLRQQHCPPPVSGGPDGPGSSWPGPANASPEPGNVDLIPYVSYLPLGHTHFSEPLAERGGPPGQNTRQFGIPKKCVVKWQVLVPHPGGQPEVGFGTHRLGATPAISMALTHGHLEGVGEFGCLFLLFRAMWAPRACRQGWSRRGGRCGVGFPSGERGLRPLGLHRVVQALIPTLPWVPRCLCNVSLFAHGALAVLLPWLPLCSGTPST